MLYEDALREWAARRIENSYKGPKAIIIDRSTVQVDMDFNEGNACCSGLDPDCYCSFAESPSCDVKIMGRQESSNKSYTVSIDHYSWDFATVLQEIVEAGGGVITNE